MSVRVKKNGYWPRAGGVFEKRRRGRRSDVIDVVKVNAGIIQYGVAAVERE